MKGFRIPRPARIQVLSDALPLKGVPTGVTRVSNNVSISTSCISCVYASPTADLCAEREIFVVLRRRNKSTLEKKNNPQFMPTKVLSYHLLGTRSIIIAEKRNIVENNSGIAAGNENTTENNSRTANYMEPQHQINIFIDRKQSSLASSRGQPQVEKSSITIILKTKTSHALDSYLY
jgi:hypothetical protein